MQGAQLVDRTTSRALDKLVNEFARTETAGQPKYFEEKVKPFLAGLSASRR
jgi:hypothetical protein